MATRDITVGVDIDAPQDLVWKAVTDWESQGDWMLGTAVRVTRGDGVGVGSELAATTGIGPLGVTDTMRIVGWDPPHRATVVHTGSFVRGSGTFTVIERGPGASRFEWGERLDLPLGILGALGWPIVAPLFRVGLVFSLRGRGGHAAVVSGAVVGEDGVGRCPWGAGDPLLREYHDTEWGHVRHGRDALYERLSLEAFQSGLSWLVILRKRPAFRAAFSGFDPEAVAAFDDADVERLLTDAGIVRNRAKILAAVANARAVLALERDGPGLDALLWSFAPDPRPAPPETLEGVHATTPASTAMAKELRRRGLRFVGPTTCHALMQATGMVDEHLAGCFRSGGS